FTRKHPDQKTSAAIQRHAEGRQVVQLYLYQKRKISKGVFYAQHHPRRLRLFRPLYLQMAGPDPARPDQRSLPAAELQPQPECKKHRSRKIQNLSGISDRKL